MYKTSLFFGLDIPKGGKVTEEQWELFVDKEISTRFPNGLSCFDLQGQWKDSDNGKIVKEKSKNIILLYSLSQKKEASMAIDSIRNAYKIQFEQQSIMRVDYGKVKVFF